MTRDKRKAFYRAARELLNTASYKIFIHLLALVGIAI
jgi:hypothetical protein